MKRRYKRLFLTIVFSLLTGIILVYLARILIIPKTSRGLRYQEFLEKEKEYYRFDPVAGFLHKAHASRLCRWPEHHEGKIYLKTNNLGFREDSNTDVKKVEPGYRVLITGDSHIDGVVYNAESFPNQLESLLNKDKGDRHFECLNGGVGHYGIKNYLGFLKRFLHLKPDLYIVVIYTGNDFLDAIRTAVMEGSLRNPPRPRGYNKGIWALDKRFPGRSAQHLNQIYFFKHFPDHTRIALQLSYRYLKEIKRLCELNHISLLIILLPSRLEIDRGKNTAQLQPIHEIVRFSDQDYQITRRLIDSLIKWLSKNHIPYLDLYQPMISAEEKLYWDTDDHLNVRGHQFVARALYQSSFKSMFSK